MAAKSVKATHNATGKTDRSKPQPLHFGAGDVGSELLSLLSEGLYSNPLDALREYVQNAVDANSPEVTIKFTGGSVTIRDTGSGMDYEQMNQARKFAISPKLISENVGFRGIGVYSSFNLCKRMTITSKVKNDSVEREMAFDFATMRSTIENQRSLPSQDRTPLVELLSKTVTYREYDSRAKIGDSFTSVQLQDVSELHYGLLSDSAGLKEYLVRTVPVDFSEDFPFREQINGWLEEYAGHRPVKIDLLYDREGRIPVRREMPSNLQEPKLELIGSESEPSAIVWYCLTAGKRAIQAGRTKFGGFHYKRKGFTIGERALLHKYFTTGSGAIFWWYVGEIVVLDDNVVPNAARDDFERTDHFNAFQLEMQRKLKELDRNGDDYRRLVLFNGAVKDAKSALEDLKPQVASATDASLVSRIEDVTNKLENEKERLPRRLPRPGKDYSDTIKGLKSLKDLLVKRLSADPMTTEDRRTEARAEATASAAALAAAANKAQQPSLQTLVVDAIEADTVDTRRALHILIDAVDSELSDRPDLYERVFSGVQSALNDL